MYLHFAHANGIPGASYQAVFDRLPEFDCFAIPRFGHDPRFANLANWDQLPDELIAYIESRTDQPVLGVGHSLGSVVTFMAACRRPDLFRGVLMLDPPLLWGRYALLSWLLKRIGKIDDITPAGKSKFRRRHWPDAAAARAYFESKPLFRFHPDSFEAFFAAAVVEAEDGGVKLFFDVDTEVEIFRNTPDNLRRQKRPDLPMKVVYADKSDASLEKMVLPFCRHFNIAHEKISGEHMFPLQQPDLAASLIRSFVRENL